VFGSMAIGSLSSGALLAHYGWTAVNAMVFPVIVVAAVLLTWVCFCAGRHRCDRRRPSHRAGASHPPPRRGVTAPLLLVQPTH